MAVAHVGGRVGVVAVVAGDPVDDAGDDLEDKVHPEEQVHQVGGLLHRLVVQRHQLLQLRALNCQTPHARTHTRARASPERYLAPEDFLLALLEAHALDELLSFIEGVEEHLTEVLPAALDLLHAGLEHLLILRLIIRPLLA